VPVKERRIADILEEVKILLEFEKGLRAILANKSLETVKVTQ